MTLHNAWPTEHVDKLRALWAAGKSLTKIVAEFDGKYSVTALAAKRKRLKLPMREAPRLAPGAVHPFVQKVVESWEKKAKRQAKRKARTHDARVDREAVLAEIHQIREATIADQTIRVGDIRWTAAIVRCKALRAKFK